MTLVCIAIFTSLASEPDDSVIKAVVVAIVFELAESAFISLTNGQTIEMLQLAFVTEDEQGFRSVIQQVRKENRSWAVVLRSTC